MLRGEKDAMQSKIFPFSHLPLFQPGSADRNPSLFFRGKDPLRFPLPLMNFPVRSERERELAWLAGHLARWKSLSE